jgi:hypothetical protein
MTVNLIRMASGEDVVATILDDTQEDTLVIRDAIVAVPTEKGQIGFAPWSPIMDRDLTEINVSRRFVVFVTVPEPQVVQHYNNAFNRVIVPDSKIIL